MDRERFDIKTKNGGGLYDDRSALKSFLIKIGELINPSYLGYIVHSLDQNWTTDVSFMVLRDPLI